MKTFSFKFLKPKYVISGSSGMCCTSASAGRFGLLSTNCGQCYQRIRVIDGKYASLYGYCELTLRRLSMITGYHYQPNAQPRMNIHFDRHTSRSFGFMPSQVQPEIFSNREGNKLVLIPLRFPKKDPDPLNNLHHELQP